MQRYVLYGSIYVTLIVGLLAFGCSKYQEFTDRDIKLGSHLRNCIAIAQTIDAKYYCEPLASNPQALVLRDGDQKICAKHGGGMCEQAVILTNTLVRTRLIAPEELELWLRQVESD